MVRRQKMKMSVKSIFCVKNSCVRKVLCLALFFLLAMPVSALAVNPEQPPSDMLGDIDANGAVDLADVILALQVCANITTSPPPTINAEADVNGDAKIGLEEVIYDLQIVSEIREN